MRFALTKSSIASSDIQQILYKHHQRIRADSNLWLSGSQAKGHYNVECRGGVSVSTAFLDTRTVFSLTEFSPAERRRLLCMCTPPHNAGVNKWFVLTRRESETCSWISATFEQYAHASLFSKGNDLTSDVFLIDPMIASPSYPLQEVLLFNAQETTNPFLIDETLRHVHLFTGEPFSHHLSSSLSTLWLQFGYTSMKWLPADALQQLGRVSILEGQAAHTVCDLETLDIIHFRQTDLEEQKHILSSVPRWVLMRSLKQPFIRVDKHWSTSRQLNLDETPKVRREVAQSVSWMGEEKENSYQLWIRCDQSSVYSGAPERRHIIKQKLFFNSSQLLFTH